MSEMTNGQQSSESSTSTGIKALEQAHASVKASIQDVQDTANNLKTAYQGVDGGGFGQLLADWENQGQVILSNLHDMITALEHTLTQHRQTQGAARDSVDHATNAAQAAFESLAG